MSANRIVKRRAFLAANTGHSYHQFQINNGERHPTFQKNIRAARSDWGASESSTDMHRFYGRSF